MPNFSLRVDGLTEARATIDALPGAFKDAVVNAIARGADIIWSEAYSRAPVRHGTLKRSIGKNIRGDGLEAAIGSGDFKAKFIEFGTNDTPAQPFLFPAFRIGAKYVREDMRTWAEEAGQQAQFKTKRLRKDVNIPSALAARFSRKST